MGNSWSNKEFVLHAVKQQGCALQFANNSLKADKEVVLTAIQQNGNAHRFADDSLNNDKDFISRAVQQDVHALQYADETLKKDKEFIKQLLEYDIFVYRYVNDGILTGKKFNALFPNVKLRKKLKDDMVMCGGYTYQIGINKDILQFKPTGQCCAGGLYCTTDKYINDFSDKDYGKNLYVVKIPDEAQVFIEGPNKLKADMLEIVRKI